MNQRYDPEVQNPGGFIGSNVLIKCNIPSFVRDHVTVTSWLQEPAFNIYPSMDGGECQKKGMEKERERADSFFLLLNDWPNIGLNILDNTFGLVAFGHSRR